MKSIEDNPQGITEAEIVVGIPSYNEADRIARPTGQADKGLRRYFGERSSVIINCDNNSPDGTRQAFMDTATETPKIYLSTPGDVRGKGQNIRNLLEKAVELKAKALVVVDADVTSVTPRWIFNLVGPLFEDFDYVAPLYVRHKYDGLLNSNIVYPLTRALYGRRVRQPIGGDFGFSGELVQAFVEADAWTDAVDNFGVDIWMTTVAVRHRSSVIQSFLGMPKVHRARSSQNDPDMVFRNVVGTVFDLMGPFHDFWKDVKWSRPTALFGFGMGEVEMASPVEVDSGVLWEGFSAGVHAKWEIYERVLQRASSAKLEEVAGLPKDGFEFPIALWAQILYDFASAYRGAVVPRDELLDVLIPLYQGKALSFVRETDSMNTQQVEEFIEDQCLQFEKTKTYLLERWVQG